VRKTALKALVRVERGGAGIQVEVPIADAAHVLNEILEVMAAAAELHPDVLTSVPDVFPGGSCATHVPDDDDGAKRKRGPGRRVGFT
jgi:hypothetical protein